MEKKFLDLIDKNIAKHINLTEAETERFHELLSLRKLKKKQFLLQEGQISRDTTFVVEGCFRGYTIDKNGFEHILSFAPPDWWMGDLYSFLSEKPCFLNIQAIEDTQFFVISKENQNKLYEEIPKFERYFRIIIEKSLISYQQRLLNNLSLTAEERFIAFCQKYPTLIQSLQQKYVASYLGVTPEFFSKMRSDFLRKKI
jgi:CRP-like cAMP-binding protein